MTRLVETMASMKDNSFHNYKFFVYWALQAAKELCSTENLNAMGYLPKLTAVPNAATPAPQKGDDKGKGKGKNKGKGKGKGKGGEGRGGKKSEE